MEWAEIDALIWLYVVLKLIGFLVNAGVAWLNAQGVLSDNVAHGILNITHS